MSKYVKKLGSDKSYKRPKTTYQEKLTVEQIEDKLQGYEKINDIAEVPLNTHIRYFIKQKDGTQLFRTGGFLHNKQNSEKYIMLNNGKNIWSVQVANTIFFKKMSQKDEISTLHRHYKKKLEEKDKQIKKLEKIIKNKISIDTDHISKKTINKSMSKTNKTIKPSNKSLKKIEKK